MKQLLCCSFALVICAAVCRQLPRNSPTKTASTRGPSCSPETPELWPNNTVPYVISRAFRIAQFPVIRRAIKILMDDIGQCVKFVDVSGKQLPETGYLFIQIGSNSHSQIGRRIGDKGFQELSLQYQSFEEDSDGRGIGNILHELLHALGLNHEHDRSDRDDYIDVKWNNISPDLDNKAQFKIKCFRTFGLPYDYNSVMHYGSNNTLAINRAYPTMLAKDKKRPKIIEWSFTLSPLDIKKIELLYKCPTSGKGSRPKGKG